MSAEIGTVGGHRSGVHGLGHRRVASRAPGYAVVIHEPEGAPLKRSREGIERVRAQGGHARQAVRGGRGGAARSASPGRRTSTTSAPATLVVEAIIEDAASRARLFQNLDALVGERTILASNTSSIPIAAARLVDVEPDRVVGLHFFSPVPVMKLVEVVVGLDTDEAVVTRRRTSPIDRQAPDPHQGPVGLHREHAADPVPHGGDADVLRRLRVARGHRRRHGARLRAPDGPAEALRLHRPRRHVRDLASRSTTSSSARSTRRRRCSSAWSSPATTAARAAAGSTSTTSGR